MQSMIFSSNVPVISDNTVFSEVIYNATLSRVENDYGGVPAGNEPVQSKGLNATSVRYMSLDIESTYGVT